MVRTLKLLILVCVTLLGSACAVVSEQAIQAARPEVPFPELSASPDSYIGRAVVLGGYIVQTTVMDAETQIIVLQTPLGLGQQPKSRDSSEGRFIVSFSNFLDPEIYSKDRKITVAGTVKGSVVQKLNNSDFQYVLIEGTEIHLWPEYEDYYYEPYPYYYDFWYYPYPYYFGYRHYPHGRR